MLIEYWDLWIALTCIVHPPVPIICLFSFEQAVKGGPALLESFPSASLSL